MLTKYEREFCERNSGYIFRNEENEISADYCDEELSDKNTFYFVKKQEPYLWVKGILNIEMNMMKYNRFLDFGVVVNIKTKDEYNELITTLKKRKVFGSENLERISFDELHKSGGVYVMEKGERCIEHTQSRGFTFGRKENYLNYGMKIVNVRDILTERYGMDIKIYQIQFEWDDKRVSFRV